jgi:hypothetical protein
VSEKKSWGSTVLGWFVEREEHAKPADDKEAALASVEDEPPPPPSPAIELKGDVPIPAEGAPIDLGAIFRAAGLPEEQQGRVDKALTLLQNLPAESPTEVKRQIVEASLKAFGVPVDQIIEAGVAEIHALHAFIEFSQRNTQKLTVEANVRIEELKAEIAEISAAMEKTAGAQQALASQCNRQKLRVQEVLEFFGQEAVARVVQAAAPAATPAKE